MKSSPVFALLSASILLAACSTAATKTTENAANEMNRKVANSSYDEWRPDSKSLPALCGKTTGATTGIAPYVFALNAVLERVNTYNYRYPLPTTCESQPGSGKGDWKGFYDQKGDKAKQLDEAIQGVGEKTAPYLVSYFDKGKPRSWSEFADVITDAANDLEKRNGISRAWATNVLNQYKEENMKNLGYVVTSCTQQYETRTYTERTEIRQSPIAVTVQVTGARLLPRECENFSISWDGRNVNGSARSDYNRYSITTQPQNGTMLLTFNNVGRVRTRPSYFAETRGSKITLSQGRADLVVKHEALFELGQVPEFRNQCRASATVTLSETSGTWWNSKTTPLKTVKFPLDSSQEGTHYTVDGLSVKADTEVSAALSVEVAPSCPFYKAGLLSIGKF